MQISKQSTEGSSKAKMMRLVLSCSLLLIVAVGYNNAQGDRFANQDGFVFPGEADRPPKFPLQPSTRPDSGRTTQPPPAIRPTPGGSSTMSPADFNRCINDCITTNEYNPVCGTDNVGYSNPGRLGCAKRCGKNVEVKSFGQCDAGNLRG